jgi:hypothetical protein
MLLELLALLFAGKAVHNSGYRDVSKPWQNYPVAAKYDSKGILRYIGGKRNGKPVGGKRR